MSNIDKKSFDKNTWNNKELKFNFGFLKLLNSLLPEHFKTIDFSNLSSHIFDKIGEILHKNITPQKRRDKLTAFFKVQQINLTNEQIVKNFYNYHLMLILVLLILHLNTCKKQ